MNTTYGDCCKAFNRSYDDKLNHDNHQISLTDYIEPNYIPYSCQEFMDYKQTKTGEKKQYEPVLNTLNRKNLIIWDWDDTIFPTSSFRTHQNEKDEFMMKLRILVGYIEKIFIEMIKLYGASNIIIVTNGSKRWINKCLNVDIIQDIFINFQNLLKKYNITTISAATKEIISKYPRNHHKWKEIVFTEYFDEFFNDIDDDNEERINCITSIGDSLAEYKASHIASKHIKNCILNRIRLKPDPSLNDMIFQLKDILLMIDQFGTDLDDIDIDYSSLISLTSSDTTSFSS